MDLPSPIPVFVVLAVVILFVIFLLIYIWGRMLRKVGPNQALIISSGKKSRNCNWW